MWSVANVVITRCDWCKEEGQRCVRFREQYICKLCYASEMEWLREQARQRQAERDAAPPADTPVRAKGNIYA